MKASLRSLPKGEDRLVAWLQAQADQQGRYLGHDTGLRPGVLMSLIGGPVFIVLLVRNRTLLSSW